MKSGIKVYRLFLALCAAIFFLPPGARADSELQSWQSVVRNSPYWVSQGVFDNLVTLRTWVLTGESYCAHKQRHILFDHRATFLGYIKDGDTTEATQQLLNKRREKLAASNKVDYWLPGEQGSVGYPFALACNQPQADLPRALARYLGHDAQARLWGTWDGMRIGAPEAKVSLHQAIVEVYRDRHQQERIQMPEAVLSTLAAKVLIESGGRRAAHSAADARGVMQLSLAALNDCQLEERFHFHRMAQIDCALRLLEQNHRNLQPVFAQAFAGLPEAKADTLYALLLIQAYHGGVGRVSGLMNDPDYNGPARYFAKHHKRFSAGDIALGMIYHNLGRNQLGFASLYYVVDVGIAMKQVCQALDDLAGCE